MKTNRALPWLAALGMLAAGCGGGNSTPKLESLDDIPSMNVQNYDYSSSSSSSSSKFVSLDVNGPGEGDFSRAGCEAKSTQLMMIQDGMQFDVMKCYIGKIANVVGLEEGEDWKYMHISFPDNIAAGEGEDEHGPPSDIRVRIRRFTNSSGQQEIQMDSCIKNPDGSYSREIAVTFKATDTGYEGRIDNQYQWSFTDFEPSQGQRVTKNFVGHSRMTAVINGFSATDFTTAEFTGYHFDKTTSGAEEGWKMYGRFTADNTEKSNLIEAYSKFSSSEFGSDESKIYGLWTTGGAGAVKYHVTGTYPAPTLEQCKQWDSNATDAELNTWCANKCYNPETDMPEPAVGGMCTFEDSDTQNFDMDLTTDPFQFVITAANSFYNTVDSATLLDNTNINSYISEVNADTDYEREWDCEAAAGSSFQEVTTDMLVNAGLEECTALEEDMDDQWLDCQNLETQFYGENN